jgi:hypothetical protein
MDLKLKDQTQKDKRKETKSRQGNGSPEVGWVGRGEREREGKEGIGNNEWDDLLYLLIHTRIKQSSSSNSSSIRGRGGSSMMEYFDFDLLPEEDKKNELGRKLHVLIEVVGVVVGVAVVRLVTL